MSLVVASCAILKIVTSSENLKMKNCSTAIGGDKRGLSQCSFFGDSENHGQSEREKNEGSLGW